MVKFPKRIWTQLAAITAISVGLGITYNSANPIGIRFTKKPSENPASTTAGPANATSPTTPASGAQFLAQAYQNFQTISWNAVKPLLVTEQVVLVDARPKASFDSGHIPGSVSLPHNAPMEELESFRKKFPPASQVVVYCTNPSCTLSKQLADKLSTGMGYQSVRLMPGGYEEYSQLELSGGSSSAALPSSESTYALDNVHHLAELTFEQMKQIVDAKSVEYVIVDARPKVNFDADRIPGAVNLPYNGQPEEFEAFRSKYSLETKFIIYCTSKTCTLSKQVADRLFKDYGYRNIRFYPGGHYEWQEMMGAKTPTVTVASPTNAPATTSTNTNASQTKKDYALDNIHHLPELTFEEMKKIVDSKDSGYVIVDARPKVNYDSDHLPGAVNLPYNAKIDEFEAFHQKHPAGTRFILYCTSKTCTLSKQVADRLYKDYGYRSMKLYPGGHYEWQEMTGVKNPGVTSKSHSPTVSAQSTTPVVAPAAGAAANPAHTTWAETKPRLVKDEVLLVDVRQAPTFDLGHIPGAVNLSYTSQAADYVEFVKKYPDKNRPIVVYCTDEHCPLSKKMADILVQKHGYKNVAHMKEGWKEWQRMELVKDDQQAATQPNK